MRALTALSLLVSASFAGAGALAWRRRPRNRVGPLMVAVGVAWLPQHVVMTFPTPARWPLLAVSPIWAALLAHLALAFPTGRLGGRAERLAVCASYLTAAVIGVDKAVDGAGAPLWAAAPVRWPVGLVDRAGAGAAVGLALVVLCLMVVRWRRNSVTQRRAVTPVVEATAVTTVLFMLLMASRSADGAGAAPLPLRLALLLSVAAIPLGYLGSLVRRRIDRAGVADLVVRLNGRARPSSLQVGLAAALHDPGLRVGYWLAEQGRYVDAEGRAMPLPPADGQVMTRVDRDGHRVAVLLHDPALLEEPELVDAACAAAALALENELLTAELRARLLQLAESRRRVLQAGEAERRRLERDLHDGVQQRLLSAAMTLALAESTITTSPDQGGSLVGEAKATVLAAIDDLRAVSHGIHPPVLAERGLAGAVRELAAVAPVPVELAVDLPGSLPPAVETTAYYVVAEAFANITKHAAADAALVAIGRHGGQVTVRVRDDGRGGADPGRGSGLRGLAERVEAHGGRLDVSSPPGEGTELRAVLPCES